MHPRLNRTGWLVLSVVALALFALRGAAADPPRTHAPAAPEATAYQYVGLNTTIARVDPATGRIFITQALDNGKRRSVIAFRCSDGTSSGNATSPV